MIEELLPRLASGNYKVGDLSYDILLYKIFVEGKEIYVPNDVNTLPIVPQEYEAGDKNYWVIMIEKFEEYTSKNGIRVRARNGKIIITGRKSVITQIENQIRDKIKYERKTSRKIIIEPEPFFTWLPYLYRIISNIHRKIGEEKEKNYYKNWLRSAGEIFKKYFDVERIHVDAARDRVTIKTKQFKLLIEDKQSHVDFRLYADKENDPLTFLSKNYNWVKIGKGYNAYIENVHKDHIFYIIDRDIDDDESFLSVVEFFAKILNEFFTKNKLQEK